MAAVSSRPSRMNRSSMCTPMTRPNTTQPSSGLPSTSLSGTVCSHLHSSAQGASATRGGLTRRRGRRRQARPLHLVDAARIGRRGLVHLRRADPRSRDCRRIPWSPRRRRANPCGLRWRTSPWRAAAHAVEIRIGREIDRAARAHRGDPADRARRDDRLERIVRQAVIGLVGRRRT